MKPFQVLHYPNPILKEKAAIVTKFDNELRDVISRMLLTMKTTKAIGLAATQVGILKRIIVIDTLKSETPANRFYGTLINPIIISESEKNISGEGCLSFPNKNYLIERYKTISVKFQNPLGETQERRFNNLTAACIQHEIDHLDGITFDTKSVGEIK